MIAAVLALALVQATPPCPAPGGWAPPPVMARSGAADGGLAHGWDTGAYAAVLEAQGMSAAGIAALRRPAGSVGEAELLAARRQARTRLAEADGAVTLDVARLAEAMRAVDAASARLAAFRTDRLLRALALLSPADRAVLVRLVGLGGDEEERGPGGPPPGGPMGGPSPFGAGGPPPPGCPPARG